MNDPAMEHDLNIRVCTIDGKAFVAGLLWEQLHKIRSYMKEARELGKTLGMDVVAIRRGTASVQAGYSPKNKGALKGMYSLAAAVASVIGPNSIVAFRVPTDPRVDDEPLYGMVATQGDLIIAGSDIVGTRAEVEQEFRAFYSRLDNWQHVAAPAEFDVADDDFDLAKSLAGKLRKEHRLQAVLLGLTRGEWVRYGGLTAGALTILIGAGYGWHAYTQHQEQAAAMAALKAAQAQALALAQKNANAPKPTLPHPWAKQHPVAAFIAACAGRRHPLPLSVQGWALARMRCTDGTFGVTYAQANGVSWDRFAEGINAKFGVSPVPDGSNYTAGSILATFVIATPYTDEQPASDEQARAAFYSHFQALGMTVDLTQAKTEVAPTKPGQPPAIVPDWHTYTFTIDTDHQPLALFQGLDTDGLRITEIDTTTQYDGATGGPQAHGQQESLHWTIKGNLYVR